MRTMPDAAFDWPKLMARVEAAVAPHIGSGKVADYIPALAKVDPRKFGMAVVLGDGAVHSIGDAAEPFSMQSISKVFALALGLEQVGDALWQRVGREPSGSPFNSIVQLEAERGIPRNPLINAGAIVVTDHLVNAFCSDEELCLLAVERLLMLMRRNAGDPSIYVDEEVARSESETGSRNRALAWFMHAFGNLEGPVEKTLHAYFRQCAIAISCVQLAQAGLFLAFDGINPITGEPVLSKEQTRRINAVMMSSGHYDNSGDFAYRIGLPGKSGVGGGILAVVPDIGTIAVWSPGLNEAGTSTVGSIALEALVRETGWSVFG